MATYQTTLPLIRLAMQRHLPMMFILTFIQQENTVICMLNILLVVMENFRANWLHEPDGRLPLDIETKTDPQV